MLMCPVHPESLSRCLTCAGAQKEKETPGLGFSKENTPGTL